MALSHGAFIALCSLIAISSKKPSQLHHTPFVTVHIVFIYCPRQAATSKLLSLAVDLDIVLFLPADTQLRRPREYWWSQL